MAGTLSSLSRSALQGGAQVIQLRDKLHDKGDVLPVARAIRDLCDRQNAILIINDHADLAVACNAHGLHLGRHDLPVGEARAILHPHQIIGTSSALLEEALESEEQGADYLAVGAIFPTDTKEKTRPAGLETLERGQAARLAPTGRHRGHQSGQRPAGYAGGSRRRVRHLRSHRRP